MIQDAAIREVLIRQARRVLVLRSLASDLEKHRAELLKELRTEHLEFFDSLAESQAELATEEATLRELTVDAYEKTGNKAPSPGVGIRIEKDLNYLTDDAIEWGNKHGGLALKLDKPTFEKLAKASPGAFPFVTITEEPQATIATDLAKALES